MDMISPFTAEVGLGGSETGAGRRSPPARRRGAGTGAARPDRLIWWTLAEATLESIWAGAHLAPEFLPDPPTAEKALKAAVREAHVEQPSAAEICLQD
jgi:hypothetical protein